MTEHICPEPELQTIHDERFGLLSIALSAITPHAATADEKYHDAVAAHALCKRVAELEAQLQEADAELCFCYRAFQEYGPTWASTPSAAVYRKAQDRQVARREASHDKPL